MKGLERQIRAGVHTGEVEVTSGNVRGLTVHGEHSLKGVAEPWRLFAVVSADG